MKRIMIYPGAFDPFHKDHMIGVLYFGKEHDMDKVIILPSYKHSEKSTQDFKRRNDIIKAWRDALPLNEEIVGELAGRYPYLLEPPSFEIDIDDNGKGYKNTGTRILKILKSNKKDDNYILLGFDAFAKMDGFCDYKGILKKANVIINNYDNEWLCIKKDKKETDVEGEYGRIILPRTKDIILDKNPVRGLHSTHIREDPEKYLCIFPNEVRKLIESYYTRQ